MTTYISAPHKGTIYIVELARKGCSKLVASAMPADDPRVADTLIPLRRVPLTLLKEARSLLLS
jgi:hypothetical protein